MRVLLAALLLLVPACAGDDGDPRATPSRTITVEQAQRIAKAGVLRAADLPGYHVVTGEDAEDSPFERGSCLRLQDNLATAERALATKDESVQVFSVAAGMPHEQAGAADLAFLSGPAFAECFERFVTAIAAEAGLSVRNYQSRTMALRVPGSAGTFGYSTTMTDVYDTARVPVRFLFLGAVGGHAETMLMAFTIDAAPPSDARLQGWLRKAFARASAAEG